MSLQGISFGNNPSNVNAGPFLQQDGNQQTLGNPFGPAAVFTPSGAQSNNFAPDVAELHALNSSLNSRTTQLINIVQQLFGGQVSTLQMAVSMLRANEGNLQDVDPEVVQRAQEDIADDGFFGVEAVSERILNFARAISGDNPAQIDRLRNAAERGFQQATRAWGGEMPEISQRTMEAVRQGFDAWAESIGQ